ncbi:unnamed protein product [Rhizophagus irregularis]|nr:unnamed protein product [Rhizophagus irregularis]
MSSVEEPINWLENEDNVKHYEYSEFKDVRLIGTGAFGNVFCGHLENKTYALKSFNNDDEQTLKSIVKELTLHTIVHLHENIIQFFGITIETDTIRQVKKYSLVLEYADSGSLKTYLKKHFSELGWNDKVDLALQLANAILFLHKNDIIHRDLHADNILVHQGKIKLADFGLSKRIAEPTSLTTEMLGVVPYIDPRSFNNQYNVYLNQNKHYSLNKKSDIYSIGVIMWLISSGRRPFYPEGVKYDISLVLSIRDGDREKIISGTPADYSNLYTRCWKGNPNERPDIQDVVSELQTIFKSDMLTNTRTQVDLFESNEGNVLTTNDFSREISNSINKSLLIENIPNIIEARSDSSRISMTDSLNHLTVNKLIKIIIKKHSQERSKI